MYSLKASIEGKLVFHSDGKWLYPLFELEEYIKEKQFDPSEIFLEDKIAGRAAAALMIRMGIRRVGIGLISRPAAELFAKHGIDCSWDRFVEKIDCRTEELISAEMSIDEACAFLRKRAGFIHGVSLEAENITAGYNGKMVLSDLNLHVGAGEQLIIAGENGCGKSTFLRTLLGLVPLKNGMIRIDGEAFSGDRKSRADGRIAYLNQIDNSNRDAVSSEEVVRIGFSSRRMDRAEENYQLELAMRRTGCFELACRNYHELSGGEKQKVSLARCLCQQSGIFLMDEPSSFLDQSSRQEFLAIVEELLLVEIPTIIIVTHDYELIEALGWPVKYLKEGRLREEPVND